MGELVAGAAELGGRQLIGDPIEFAAAGTVGGSAGEPNVGVHEVVFRLGGVGIDQAEIELGDRVARFGLLAQSSQTRGAGLSETEEGNREEEEGTH